MSELHNLKIKGIPKSEEICVRHRSENGDLIYITTRDYLKNYKLYKYENGQATYTKHKSNNPLNFEKYM